MDTILFGTNASDKWHYVLVGALLVFEVILLLKQLDKDRQVLSFDRKPVLLLSGWVLLIVCTQVTAMMRGTYHLEIQYFYHILLLIIVLTCLRYISEEEFVCEYSNVMCFLAVAAIALFVLEQVGIAYDLPSYRVINKSGYLYYHMGLGVVAEPRPYVIIRAYGIFREPAVFAIHLCVALYFELFRKRTSFSKVIIFGIAVLITYSTAGYIVLGCYVAIYIAMRPSQYRVEQREKLVLVLVCMAFLLFGTNEEVRKEVFEKLFVENDSLYSRIYSLIGGVTYSMQKPFFGHGWNEVIYDFGEYIYSQYNFFNISPTNTYIRMADIYGWLLTLTTLYGVWRFHRKNEKNPLLAIALFLCWIMIFSNGDLVLNPLGYVIAYYGMDTSLEKRKLMKR